MIGGGGAAGSQSPVSSPCSDQGNDGAWCLGAICVSVSLCDAQVSDALSYVSSLEIQLFFLLLLPKPMRLLGSSPL